MGLEKWNVTVRFISHPRWLLVLEKTACMVCLEQKCAQIEDGYAITASVWLRG
jgi:hypothetical protein